jgi:hypothetical protein
VSVFNKRRNERNTNVSDTLFFVLLGVARNALLASVKMVMKTNDE